MPTCWSGFNNTQNRELRLQVVPVEDVGSKTGGKVADVLLFFESAGQSIAQGDTITIRSHHMRENGMILLEKTGSDFILATNKYYVPIELVDIVLVYPKVIGVITVALGPSDEPRQATIIPDATINREYASIISSDYSIIGLRTENLGPGASARAVYTKLSQH